MCWIKVYKYTLRRPQNMQRNHPIKENKRTGLSIWDTRILQFQFGAVNSDPSNVKFKVGDFLKFLCFSQNKWTPRTSNVKSKVGDFLKILWLSQNKLTLRILLQKIFRPIVSTQPSQLSLVASPGPRIPKEPFNRQIRASLLSESLYAFALDLSQRLRPRPNLIVEWNNISFIITIDHHS